MDELIEDYMKLLPHRFPKNEDTFMKLHSWIGKNLKVAETWKENPPSLDDENLIYNIFGCTNKCVRECKVCKKSLT